MYEWSLTPCKLSHAQPSQMAANLCAVCDVMTAGEAAGLPAVREDGGSASADELQTDKELLDELKAVSKVIDCTNRKALTAQSQLKEAKV